MAYRFPVLSLICQDSPDVKMRQRVVRLPLDSLTVKLQSLVEPPLLFPKEAQIVQGLQVKGIDLHRLPEHLFRLNALALLEELHFVVVVTVGMIGVEADSGAEVILCLLRFFRLAVLGSSERVSGRVS